MIYLWFLLIVPAYAASSALLRKEPPEMSGKGNSGNSGGQAALPGDRGLLHKEPPESLKFGDGGGQIIPPESAYDLIWDGVDMDLPSIPTHDSASTGIHGINKSVQVVPIQIFGNFDSGTNLVAALLDTNFKENIKLQEYLWKHSSVNKDVKNNQKLTETFRRDGVATIAMVRDPISWLQSVRKAPYDFKNCVGGRDWLNSTCYLPTSCKINEGTCAISPKLHDPSIYASVADYWNENGRDYNQLAQWLPKVIVVRYEDLVLDTDTTMARISSTLGLQRPDKFQSIENPAASHGDQNGRQAAIQKIQTKSFLSLYTPDDKKMACQRIDTGLMHSFQYDNC